MNARVLRQARLDARLSLADVAGDSMSKQAVHQFETGRARPTMARLKVIVERLGNLTVEDVLAETSEHRMAELDRRRQFADLGVTARALLRQRSAGRRTRALATFYAAKAVLDRSPAQAATLFGRARRLLLRVSEPALAAEALDWEAAALYLVQDVRAVEVGRRALDCYRSLSDRTADVEARMLEHIGTFCLQRGEHVAAIASYREAIEVAGGRLELTRLAHISHGLAEGYRQANDTTRALEYMERAVHFYRTDRDVRGQVDANLARTENDYGVHLMRAGHLDRAEVMIRAALDHYAESGVEAGRSHALLSMGELSLLRGRPDEAIDWTAQAIERSERRAEAVGLASGYQQLGEIWAARGDRPRFEASFDRALEVLDAAGLPELAAECLARLHRLSAAPYVLRPPAS